MRIYPPKFPLWGVQQANRERRFVSIDTHLVIVAAGQSNEQGTCNPPPVAEALDPFLDVDPTGRILVWQTGASAPKRAIQPFTWPANNGNLGPTRSMAFAKAILPRVAQSKNVHILPMAVGGTKLVAARWAVGGDLQVLTKAEMGNIATYLGGDCTFIMLWLQGEQDGNDGESEASYISAFTAMVASFRTVAGASTMPVILGQMVPERLFGPTADRPLWNVIDIAHKKIPLTVANTIFVGASFGYQRNPDLSHFTGPGHRLAGERALVRLPFIESLKAAKPDTPSAFSAAGSVLSWKIPNTLANAYVLQSHPLSGGSWTEALYFPSMYSVAGDSMSVTVAPFADSEFRLVARSAAGDSAPTATVQVLAAFPMVGAKVHLDYTNNRYYVNGTAYPSIAAMVTAGVYTQSANGDYVTIAMSGTYTLFGQGVTKNSTIVGQLPRYLVSANDGATTNLAFMAQADQTAAGGPNAVTQGQVITAGVSQTDIVLRFGDPGISAPVKMAMRIAANSIAFSVNGQNVVTDSTATVPTTSRITVGNRTDGTRAWGGTIGQIIMFDSGLTNTQLQALTA